MEYENRNRGALFKNNDKTEETHPDYRGSINIGGVDHWLSAWIKTSKKGMKYMSLSVQPKDAESAQQKNETTKPAGGGAVPCDIPFGPEFR
jgi:uncharacterized protein (DUF736 family)